MELSGGLTCVCVCPCREPSHGAGELHGPDPDCDGLREDQTLSHPGVPLVPQEPAAHPRGGAVGRVRRDTRTQTHTHTHTLRSMNLCKNALWSVELRFYFRFLSYPCEGIQNKLFFFFFSLQDASFLGKIYLVHFLPY